ncbi:MAG: hypothetical protein J1E31_03240 [Helicobacter sp.]|nr:hypothetical protein [Helicobacter sp.]
MEKFVLLHNNFYTKSSNVLTKTSKTLLEMLEIRIDSTKQILVESKFLPFIEEGIPYYSKLFKAFLEILETDKIPLCCDSQTLLAYQNLLALLQENADFREKIIKDSKENINLFELDKTLTFLPQLIFERLDKTKIINQRWSSFKCGLIVDRELERFLKDWWIVEKLERVSGLRVQTFFKESYAYLLNHNANLAYKMASKDYYEITDCGVDFIATFNIEDFHLFDEQSLKIKKASGRDDLEVPILFLPQIILLLLENTKTHTLCFNEHQITPKMI